MVRWIEVLSAAIRDALSLTQGALLPDLMHEGCRKIIDRGTQLTAVEYEYVPLKQDKITSTGASEVIS